VPVLGVDDFAFRKDRHYGTVLIDIATRRPIEIFNGHDGADLAAWLRRHDEVRVIGRDRSAAFQNGCVRVDGLRATLTGRPTWCARALML